MAVHNRRLPRLFTQRPHSCEQLEPRRLAVGCDVTQDGACDFADLRELLDNSLRFGGDLILGQRYWGNQPDPGDGLSEEWIGQHDVNGDGDSNFRDLDDWWSVSGVTPGDFDTDGEVDADDFLTLWDNSPDLRDLSRFWRVLGEYDANPEDPLLMMQFQEVDDLLYGTYGDGIKSGRFDTASALDRTGIPNLSLRGDNQDPLLSVFSLRDGDVSNDGRFNSSDLVKVAQEGLADDLDTGELVRIFQLGTYER